MARSYVFPVVSITSVRGGSQATRLPVNMKSPTFSRNSGKRRDCENSTPDYLLCYLILIFDARTSARLPQPHRYPSIEGQQKTATKCTTSMRAHCCPNAKPRPCVWSILSEGNGRHDTPCLGAINRADTKSKICLLLTGHNTTPTSACPLVCLKTHSQVVHSQR